MKQKEWNEGMDHLDPDLVETYVEQKDRLKRKSKKPTGRWVRVAAVAACLALVIGAAVAVPMLREDEPGIVVGTDADTTKGNDRPDVPTVNVQAPSLAPQYYGSESSANSSLTEQAEIVEFGVSVTARFAEALPDTYLFFDDWWQTEFRLIKLEVVTVLEGVGMPSEFWMIVPLAYMTDYSVFDKLVLLDIAQYGYEHSVVYNQTQGRAEQLDIVLFGYSSLVYNRMGVKITAFDSDDRFDMRLWEATEAWKLSTHHTVEYYGTEYYESYTRMDAEEEARNSGWGEDYVQVRSLVDVSGEAAEALAYISSFENGVYVTGSGGLKHSLSPGIQLSFRKYINGFATNESGMIYANEVVWSKARFTEEDEARLPDLQAAVAAVIRAHEAGDILSPHLQNFPQDKLKSSGIVGWYAKTASGVIGVVCISWCYEDRELQYYEDNRYFDDAYYIIEYGSDECIPMERDAVLARIGADYEGVYMYTGDYDAYGKVRNRYAPIP